MKALLIFFKEKHLIVSEKLHLTLFSLLVKTNLLLCLFLRLKSCVQSLFALHIFDFVRMDCALGDQLLLSRTEGLMEETALYSSFVLSCDYSLLKYGRLLHNMYRLKVSGKQICNLLYIIQFIPLGYGHLSNTLLIFQRPLPLLFEYLDSLVNFSLYLFLFASSLLSLLHFQFFHLNRVFNFDLFCDAQQAIFRIYIL